MMNPSKGGSDIAQSFMQNKATQPTGQMPTIQQPQQQGLPQIAPQPGPAIGAAAQGGPKPGTMDYVRDYMRTGGNGLFRSPHPTDPSLERVFIPNASRFHGGDGGGSWQMVNAASQMGSTAPSAPPALSDRENLIHNLGGGWSYRAGSVSAPTDLLANVAGGQYEIDKIKKRYEDKARQMGLTLLGGNNQQQPFAPTFQPSRASQLAQAINERAQRRG